MTTIATPDFESVRSTAKRIGKSVSGIYEDVKAGLLPPPIVFGARCSRRKRADDDQVFAARAAGANCDEIRELVRQIIARRKDALVKIVSGAE